MLQRNLPSSSLNLTPKEALVEAFWWLLVQQVGYGSLLEAAGCRVLQSAEAFSWRPAPPPVGTAISSITHLLQLFLVLLTGLVWLGEG